MKKITTFLALLLTCIIGATAADFVPTAGTKYLIKCKGNSKYVLWNSSCVKSGTDNRVILSNWVQFDSRSLFSIEGNAANGYTIRSVKDNTQYVYAINTDDADGNVGVKAVTETPGDECVWKIVAQGDGWNIIPKNGSYSWNNRGSYNGNAHVGMWNSNANADDVWYIKPVDDVVNEVVTGLNGFTFGKDLGIISENYKSSVNTNAAAYRENQSEEALANLGALAVVNKASYINLPTGYYRLKSCQNDGDGNNFSVFDGTYLFTDIINYPNVTKTLANVPLDEAKAKNNYVWKITRGEFPSATIDIVNGQGKGVNNGTNYSTINLGLSDYYTTGAIYFTQGLHVTNQGQHTVGGKQNTSAEATRSNPFKMTDWNHSDSKGSAYIFEPVSMEDVTAYTVNVTGADQGSVTLNSTNEVAMNGGFFFLSSTPQVSDFTAKILTGYDVAAFTIEGTTINVSYAHNYAYAKAEAEAAIAKMGVGYPTANAAARTTLKKAIDDAAAADPNITTAATLLAAVDAYKKSKADIQMPEDGKAYVITNIHKTGGKRYMKYQADGTSMIARDDAAELPIEATYICHKVDGKYVFANNSGTYLTWRGKETGDCTNNNLGYTTSYNADYNTFTVAVNPDVFGCLSFGAKRNNAQYPQSYYIITASGSFEKAGLNNFYTDAYSSAFTFEEVTYPNTITFNDAQSINGVSHIATFSAPFATIIPAGVKAYYVSAKGAEATMTAIEAQAIPANQGVILTSESGDAATMVPAAGETAAAITGNQLGHSAGVAKSLTAGEGYILGNGTEGTAFYPCQAGSLPINKAYLLGNGESAIVMNFGNAVTGINTIAAPASAKAPIFDLSGRRVVKATKGLYIQNGKKVIVK